MCEIHGGNRGVSQADSELDGESRSGRRLDTPIVWSKPVGIFPLFSDVDRLPKAKYRVMEEVSPINHVDGNSAPTLVRYNGKLSAAYGTHHASFGKGLKEMMDAVGVCCEVVAGGQAIADSQSKSIGGFIKEEFKSSGWTNG